MDKILSARVDEPTIQKIGLLARKLKKTKKAVIEEAIRSFADQSDMSQAIDILDQTCGAWSRPEHPRETVRRGREAFRKTMERHQPWGPMLIQSIIDLAGGLYRRWHPGYGVDIHDALLAATAMKTGGVIYTLNKKHYPMPDLAVHRAWWWNIYPTVDFRTDFY
jgi:hypothetical protein